MFLVPIIVFDYIEALTKTAIGSHLERSDLRQHLKHCLKFKKCIAERNSIP